VLIVGAHFWARAIARALSKEGFKVLLVDTNLTNIEAAQLEGLNTYHGSILSEDALVEIDLSGIGYLLALTANDEANSLAALHFAGMLGRSSVYQLPPDSQSDGHRSDVPKHLRGRLLFGNHLSYTELTDRFLSGAGIRAIRLTTESTWDDVTNDVGEPGHPLFIITERKDLVIIPRNNPPRPLPGQTVLVLVDPEEERSREAMLSRETENL
jgi:hypothetical protein